MRFHGFPLDLEVSVCFEPGSEVAGDVLLGGVLEIGFAERFECG